MAIEPLFDRIDWGGFRPEWGARDEECYQDWKKPWGPGHTVLEPETRRMVESHDDRDAASFHAYLIVFVSWLRLDAAFIEAMVNDTAFPTAPIKDEEIPLYPWPSYDAMVSLYRLVSRAGREDIDYEGMSEEEGLRADVVQLRQFADDLVRMLREGMACEGEAREKSLAAYRRQQARYEKMGGTDD
jgi:hypothetical protein